MGSSDHLEACKALRPYRSDRDASLALQVVTMLLLVCCGGCAGRTIKAENPVFAEAPPRRSLVNQSADAEEQKLAMGQQGTTADFTPISLSRKLDEPLTGMTVVAQVNGKPVFVDDVLGGARQIIESDPRLPEDRRQMVIESTLRKRLPKYVEDELIVQALEKKIPADKREAIKDTLEPQFQKILLGIKEKEGFVTDQQLNDRLSAEGISIDALRENFLRMQMVEGYIGTTVKVPETIDREELVRYYQEHISDYTPEEEVRFAEIVIRFRDHGGREGAEQAMTTVVQQLQSGQDFGDVATAMSDTLTSEKRGELGWIRRKSLSDEALENLLFSMSDGEISSVQVRDDRFEVYKVIDHRDPGTKPFQEVQKEIEQLLLEKLQTEAREKVRSEIRQKGNVVTIFGDSLDLIRTE